tara:strand:- start:25471 stop:26124 length:654 start_codon:yes stop_codon:yes gene_type:complete
MLSKEAIAVQQALIQEGLETPMIQRSVNPSQQQHDTQEIIMQLMHTLGLDLRDDSLKGTPARIAKMFTHEIFAGLNYANFPSITTVDNKMNVDDVINVSQIQVTSTCEHHFITIDGFAQVAYIPKHKILGLSKINRIVQFFAQRPQIQERLTQQIKIAIQTLTDSADVAVRIRATHFCVKARGVMDTSSMTTTLALGGQFKENKSLRAEFVHSTEQV